MSVEPMTMFEMSARWPLLQEMPVRMSVRIPLLKLKLREVQSVTVGAVMESAWSAAEEVPLYAANVLLSWCEFAVVDGVMSARLTRLG